MEFLLCTVMPLFASNEAILTPTNWRLNGLVIDCYLLFGLAGGALGAVFAERWSRGANRTGNWARQGASLSLLLAIILNLGLDFRWGGSVIIVMAIATALFAAVLWSLRHPALPLAGWMELHPLLLASLLLGPTWLGAEFFQAQSNLFKAMAELLLVAAIFAMQWGVRRMPRRSAATHFFACLALLAILVVTGAELSGSHVNPPPTARLAAANPHGAPVVLVSLDTTRADHLSVYGYAKNTSPSLEAFAAGATLYTNAEAAADMTLPSHASMFTGVYPSWHGAHVYSSSPQLVRGLDDKLPTLAGMLSAKGYFAAGVAANTVFLKPHWGLSRGFSSFTSLSPVSTNAGGRYYLRFALRQLLSLAMTTADFDAFFRRAGDVNEDAYRILDRESWQKHSFFLFVNYMDAHWPYLPPTRFLDRFSAARHLLDPYQQNVARAKAIRTHNPTIPAMAQLGAQYDAGIACEDEAFGGLMQRLKDEGVYDQALVIVTGDHGEAFGERGLVGHGTSVYADQIHVPLLIKYPHQTAPAVVGAAVSHVDILPTVMDTLGYTTPAYVQGRNLRDLEGLANRQIVSESFPSMVVSGSNRTERALRRGDMKLVLSTSGKRELYDVSSDPNELHNLAPGAYPQAASLESSLRQWIAHVPHPGPELPMLRNAAEIRRLKSLGYVQ
jgi:arylsulfatase A-like enzyme